MLTTDRLPRIREWVDRVDMALRRIRAREDSRATVDLVATRMEMSSSAWAYFITLPKDARERRSWTALRTSLCATFDTATPEVVLNELSKMRATEYPTLFDFHSAFVRTVQRLPNQTMAGSLVERFIDAMPRDLAAHLRMSRPISDDHMVYLTRAIDYVRAWTNTADVRRLTPRSGSRYNSEKEGTETHARAQREVRRERPQFQRISNLRPGVERYGQKVCYSCRQPGHIAADCPVRSRPNGFNPSRPQDDRPPLGVPKGAVFARLGAAKPTVSEPQAMSETKTRRVAMITSSNHHRGEWEDEISDDEYLVAAVKTMTSWQAREESLITCTGMLRQLPQRVLIDPGSEVTCVSPQLWKILRTRGIAEPLDQRMRVKAAGGAAAQQVQLGMVKEPLEVFGYRAQLGRVAVLDIVGYDVLLGMEWLRPNNAVIRCGDGTVWFKPSGVSGDKQEESNDSGAGTQLIYTLGEDQGVEVEIEDDEQLLASHRRSAFLEEEEAEETRFPTPPWQTSGPADYTDTEWQELKSKALRGAGQICVTEEDKEALVELEALLEENRRSVFPKTVDTTRPMKVAPVKIITAHENPVGRMTRQNLPQVKKDFLFRTVKEMEKLAIISPSLSSYSAPPVIAAKRVEQMKPTAYREPEKGKQIKVEDQPTSASSRNTPVAFRFCNDFRRLNEITIKKLTVIPTISGVLNELADAYYFTKVDCTSGYFQMKLDEQTKHKTAFHCELGNFEYNVCPFGLTNLPAEYNAAMAEIFADMLEFVRQYFDDLIIHTPKGRGIRAHIETVRSVLQRCCERNVQLSMKKSIFLDLQVAILGYVVSNGQVAIPGEAVEAVTELAEPGSIKELERFLGMVGFHRQFVDNFARIALPLTELVRRCRTGDNAWVWSEDHKKAFEELKERLAKAPLLKIPRKLGEPGYGQFKLFTDASEDTLGAVLVQEEYLKGPLQPVRFMSRKLTAAERKYSVVEKEALCIVWAASKKCADILLDVDVVEIYCDNEGVVTLLNPDADGRHGRIGRWGISMQPLRYVIKRIKGSDNVSADALSRLRRRSWERNLEADLQVIRPEPESGHATPQINSTPVPVLDGVLRKCIPSNQDGLNGRARPKQTKYRTGKSVTSWTTPTAAVMAQGYGTAYCMAVTRSQTKSATPRNGTDQPRTEVPQLRSQSQENDLLREFPKEPVWHEEIWLSTAVHEWIRGTKALDLPERIKAKVVEDAKMYAMTFDAETGVPISIRKKQVEEDGVIAWLTVPPPSQRLALVIENHQWGHFGADKTNQRLEAKGLWWIGRLEDTKNLVARCPACMRSANYQTKYHPARSLPVPQGIFDRVHIDIMSVGEAKDGAKHVLLLIDALSKYPIGYPLKTKEAGEVASKLWKTICVFGTPSILHSDNGSEFVNEVMTSMCQIHGIQRKFITAYRPQANGQVERLGRTVANVLRKCCGEEEEYWPEWLDFVLLAIRTTAHSATGLTPFEVMFGREFRPLGNYHALADWSQPDPDVEELLSRRAIMLRRLVGAEGIERSRSAMEEAGERYRLEQDRWLTIAEERLKPGTRVLLRMTGTIPKLKKGNEGPFFIASEEPDTPLSANYGLMDEQGQRLERTFPRDYLFECPQKHIKLTSRQLELYTDTEWREAEKEIGLAEPGPVPKEGSDEMDSASWWVVEDVMAIDAEQQQAQVKWVGYDSVEWIPLDAFERPEEVQGLLGDFQRKIRHLKTGRFKRSSASRA